MPSLLSHLLVLHQPSQEHSPTDTDDSPVMTLPETAPLALAATLTAEIILVTLEAKMASMVHRVTNTQQRQICRKSKVLLGEGTPDLGE